MDPSLAQAPPTRLASRLALGLLLALLALMSLAFVRNLLSVQPPGVDFAPMWAGGRAALSAPHRLYDFEFITRLQGWSLRPGLWRPFVYPPSALFVFVPFALLPLWPAYGLWLVATGAAFWIAGLRAGAPWWFVVLPWVTFAALCGQVDFLVGALVLGGLVLSERRSLAAGLLFGLAAAVKPQLLVLLPIALLAQGRLSTLLAGGLAAATLAVASAAIWGLEPWRQWLAALPRFQAEVADVPSLVRNALTPYAALSEHGVRGTWAMALAPLAALWVWVAFRRQGEIADRLIALIGGALTISPYAMNYEMALLAPATAIYLARTAERGWPLYALSAYLQSRSFGMGLLTLIPALALPLVRRLARLAPSSNPNRSSLY